MILKTNPSLSMYEFFSSLRNKDFRTQFIKQFERIRYEEYTIEFPSVTYTSSKTTEFELKVHKASKSLSRNGAPNDKLTFDFHDCTKTRSTKAIAFISKTGRSYLVVPCPKKSSISQYDSGHIGQFMRKAKKEYVHAFWKKISEVFFDYFKYRNRKRFQLLTHGHDVFWLHAKFNFQ